VIDADKWKAPLTGIGPAPHVNWIEAKNRALWGFMAACAAMYVGADRADALWKEWWSRQSERALERVRVHPSMDAWYERSKIALLVDGTIATMETFKQGGRARVHCVWSTPGIFEVGTPVTLDGNGYCVTPSRTSADVIGHVTRIDGPEVLEVDFLAAQPEGFPAPGPVRFEPIRAVKSWTCGSHGCPERSPIAATEAPKCYTCERPMREVAGSSVKDAIDRMAMQIATECALPKSLLGPTNAADWHSARKQSGREVRAKLNPSPLGKINDVCRASGHELDDIAQDTYGLVRHPGVRSASGGIDPETDEELRSRVLRVIQACLSG
jgi:hypothetical protein